MIIKQVLNNNVAIAITENGEEVIAMGKGSCSQKRKVISYLIKHPRKSLDSIIKK
ncbi:hypothetical protein KJB68_11620 [Mammaliicoccus sciuri]|uniref:CAT RNA binding domain-containing protein n=1 Tax=Mammaliicoccus sciuri TaxID=1296 RepID=UPI00398BD561|nr:hypothetical protein [Mammaliicoccus sciuri]